ncbi:hypothetical protein B2G71_03570 [Novosphingobium sp. PC22D]|nr:hypothetical protein B2G71_03570 [Novosphingobium sp. PC22D]
MSISAPPCAESAKIVPLAPVSRSFSIALKGMWFEKEGGKRATARAATMAHAIPARATARLSRGCVAASGPAAGCSAKSRVAASGGTSAIA